MTDRLDTRHDTAQPTDPRTGDDQDRTPWQRPVVTRIPLSVTLAATGSLTDGFTGSLPS
jgi:hypothetical protein